MALKSFELVFEGLVEDTEAARAAVMQVLTTECGLEHPAVQSILSGDTRAVTQARSARELEQYCQSLRAAGGKVMIVKATAATVSNNIESTPARPSLSKFYSDYTANLTKILQQIDLTAVEALVEEFLSARHEGRTIFIMGNGGSAAMASHMSNDFAKHRFDDESTYFRIVGLSDNVSWITATANDEGYDRIFVNQLQNLLNPGDVVLAISSSGNSPNVIKAIEYANARGATTWGIVGFGGGLLKSVAQKSIDIPSKKGQYGYMEDVTHILNHIVSIYIYECDRAARTSRDGITQATRH